MNNNNERLNGIRAYKQNTDIIRKTNAQKELNQRKELINKIQALKPRIEELINVANACLESNIIIYNDTQSGYDKHNFVANAFTHRTGFITKANPYYHKINEPIEYLGVLGGGICHYDLKTNGINVIVSGVDANLVMQRFLNEFDTFESEFYNYVDKVVEQQQNYMKEQAKDEPDITDDYDY